VFFFFFFVNKFLVCKELDLESTKKDQTLQ